MQFQIRLKSMRSQCHRTVKFEAGEENRIVHESLYWYVWKEMQEMRKIFHIVKE